MGSVHLPLRVVHSRASGRLWHHALTANQSSLNRRQAILLRCSRLDDASNPDNLGALNVITVPYSSLGDGVSVSFSSQIFSAQSSARRKNGARLSGIIIRTAEPRPSVHRMSVPNFRIPPQLYGNSALKNGVLVTSYVRSSHGIFQRGPVNGNQ